MNFGRPLPTNWRSSSVALSQAPCHRLVEDHPAALWVYAGILQHVETADASAFLDALQGVEGIGILRAIPRRSSLGPQTRYCMKSMNLLHHRRADNVERIAEIFGLDRVPGDVELKAAVAHGAHINEGFIEQVGRDGDFVVAQQVLLSATVVVERTVEGTVEQCPVEADVPVLAFLPAQVGVDVLARSPHLVVLAVVGVVAEALHGVQRLVTVEVLVARHAIVGAQFQVGEPALGLCHERLVGDTPSYGDGGKLPHL